MADGSVWPGRSHNVGDHVLHTGDCIEIMEKEIAKGSIDVVVTSPPYNLNIPYNSYYDSREEKEYLDWLTAVSEKIKDILNSNGSFFLNISGSNSMPWIPFEMVTRLRKLGFRLQNHITWIKSITIQSASSGHFKPVPGKRFMHHNHEHIFHLTTGNGVEIDRLSIGIPFQDKSNISRRHHPRDLRCRGNTWFIPYPTVKTKAQKFWHPGTFPVELPLWCIYLHGLRDAVVLDPFVGTGSSLVASHFARTKGIGIDIDPSYIATAHQRLSEAVENTMFVTLNQDEISELFKQDEAKRGGGGWQSRLVKFQQMVNKTTGELSLTDDDVAWIKKYGSHPEDGSWQKWIRRAFERHIELDT